MICPVRCSLSPQALRAGDKVQSVLRWGIASISILIAVNLPQNYSHVFHSCPLTPSFSCENVWGPPCFQPLVSSHNWGSFTCRCNIRTSPPPWSMASTPPGSGPGLAECFEMEKVKLNLGSDSSGLQFKLYEIVV